VDRWLIALLLCVLLVAIAIALRLRQSRLAQRLATRLAPQDFGFAEIAGTGIVLFSSPYCLSCRAWEQSLSEAGMQYVKLDVADRPDLASRYGVAATPAVFAVRLDTGSVLASYAHDPTAQDLDRLRSLCV
jgi:hypothetical protein